MNPAIQGIVIWLLVFLLALAIPRILRVIRPGLDPIVQTFIMTALLVPLMMYSVIPFFGKLSHAEPLQRNLTMSEIDQTDRYKKGWEKLKEIDGEAGEKVINSLQDIAPDLGRYIIEYPFGDVYSRPGLDLKSREIATIAALTAMGNAKPQLKVHIQAGLNVGLTQEEIVETIIQMSVYAGFPAALNGMQAAREVFEEKNESK